MFRTLKSLAGGVAPPHQDFPADLYAAEAERHRSILDREDAGIPRNPRGFSILDDDSPRGRGFYPLAEAARRMSLSEEETLALCGRELEAFGGGSTLYVRPAIVSILGGGAIGAPEAAKGSGGSEYPPLPSDTPEAA